MSPTHTTGYYPPQINIAATQFGACLHAFTSPPDPHSTRRRVDDDRRPHLGSSCKLGRFCRVRRCWNFTAQYTTKIHPEPYVGCGRQSVAWCRALDRHPTLREEPPIPRFNNLGCRSMRAGPSSSLAMMLAWGARGREFESHRSHHFIHPGYPTGCKTSWGRAVPCTPAGHLSPCRGAVCRTPFWCPMPGLPDTGTAPPR